MEIIEEKDNVELEEPNQALDHPDYDGAWKDVLDAYLEEFILLCWPEKHKEIDWEKGYKMIDKEFIGSPQGSRQYLDKLIEFYLKDGSSTSILLHIEIERSNRNIFLKRIFHYRIHLECFYPDQIIATLAILIDDSKKWRPFKFRKQCWGSYIEVGFPHIKILDFESRVSELEASNNPFASIILAQLTISQHKDDESKLDIKYRIIQRLYEKNFSREDIIRIFNFLERVMVLPDELELEYIKEVTKIEEERKVAYINSIERRGIQQGECLFLLDLLQHKFKTVPEDYRHQIEKADPQTLKKWGFRLFDCESLEDIFKT